MLKQNNLQIGTSNYEQLLEAGGYFVDKTLLVQEVIDSGFHVMLIPRPRRFGKSLNLSMLEYYFDYRKENTARLFEPFKIWQAGDKYRAEHGKRPVIHLSFKKAKGVNYEESQKGIFQIISETYGKFRWLLSANILSQSEENKFRSILDGKADYTLYTSAIKFLSEYLYQHSGEKTLILLDEYDAAIHTGYNHNYYDEIVNLMKAILGETFKGNDSLYKGIITGILRIAKESMFSDMNNAGVFTILKSSFDDKFGFTDPEVRKMLKDLDYSADYQEIKSWYNGYRFGKTNEIYNPWSVINYLAQRADGFKSYWGNTSSDDIIKSSISGAYGASIRSSLEQLLRGEVIELFINENITFTELKRSSDVFWSLATFAGYLTPVREIGYDIYELRIPNFEIKLLFSRIVLNWLNRDLQVQTSTLYLMAKALTENKIPEFERHFRKVMGDTFSYFDTHKGEPERVFQAYLLGLLGILTDQYIIKSNRESGGGRYDILMIPKDKARYGVIMELKQIEKEAGEKRVKTTLRKALKQIEKNKYHRELAAQEIDTRLEMAVVFVGKDPFLEWQFKTNDK